MNSINLLVCTLIVLLNINPNDGRDYKDIDYLLKKAGIQKNGFNLKAINNREMLVTDLDDIARHLLIHMRRAGLKLAKEKRHRVYRLNREQGKIQKTYKWNEFPCKLNGTRSPEPPNSVNELRPGDIDIVAAMGDSLSAGNGLMSETVVNILSEFRGMAFSGGGMADWRTVLTLPNILKVFNPNLYGYSTDNVLVADRKSYLNIAEPMLMSRDMVYQAHIIIQRMRKDPRIDLNKHWKLLTIFVGSNDICSDMCHQQNLSEFVRRHEEDLRKTFTVLRDNVPRLLINLVPAPNMVNTLHKMQNIPFACRAVHYGGCNCVFSEHYGSKYLHVASEIITRWQNIEERVASLPEFQTQDFAVLFQPFMTNITVPILANGKTDLRFLASDCFHLSQLGHAAAANVLWNNMLQSPGQKESEQMQPLERFECPTADRPYIVTLRNSYNLR